MPRPREPPLYEYCLCGRKSTQNRSNNATHLKRDHGDCAICGIVLIKPHQRLGPSHLVEPGRLILSSETGSSSPTITFVPYNHPSSKSPDYFTVLCVVENDDDTDQDTHHIPTAASSSYNPDQSPFCNVTLGHVFASIPWLTNTESLVWLKKTFGGLFVAHETEGTADVHQSLLTGLFAHLAEPTQKSILLTWKVFRDLLHACSLHTEIKLNPQSDNLIIVLFDTSFGSKRAVHGRYDDLESYLLAADATRSTIIHPSKYEAYADGNKLDDIRALDRVAGVQGTWRPRTCFGAGPCALEGVDKDFKKRSWSSCAVHTTANGGGYLTCTPTKPSRKKRRVHNPKGHWFHQEYVEMLAKVEYRVYIVAKPDPSGTRGSRGRVIRVCCTERNADGKWKATEATDGRYQDYSLTEDTVVSFALSVYEALRTGERWATQFRSLDVGCRLDISAKEPGGPLFVNEVTRWYRADYFSDYCTGEPHTLLCNAYADAWIRYADQVTSDRVFAGHS
ncbi:hypothetical protein LZ31DRAFT_561447 [Colletotrichum somersetense]|nr:hypothetical protein LZ31DRAFT_561447 [Colletotrichum somersetense]